LERDAIRKLLVGDDPSSLQAALWTPLLTHYRAAGRGAAVDPERMALHAEEVGRHSKWWLVAGSVGDGWDLSEELFDAVLAFARRPELRRSGVRTVIGALRPTTIAVKALIERIHRTAGTSPGATLESNVLRFAARGWAGVAVAPPVGAGVTQEEIVLHYRDVCASERLPVMIHQLPHATRNEIAPSTFARIREEHEGVIAFADSSGDDEVARVPDAAQGVIFLRGAEGRYAETLKALGGSYDGLIPCAANCLGARLREVLAAVDASSVEKAKALARSLSELVRRLFEAGAGAPIGGVDANVARAADHCLAYGRAYHEFPSPVLFDGSRLPERVLARVASILDEAGLIQEAGYLAARGA
jgi:dihydrodipicolinate synthase/N-acetylneuraminate lyase